MAWGWHRHGGLEFFQKRGMMNGVLFRLLLEDK
jgi:hypothetical protein